MKAYSRLAVSVSHIRQTLVAAGNVPRRGRRPTTAARRQKWSVRPYKRYRSALLLTLLTLITAGFASIGLLIRPTDTGPPPLTSADSTAGGEILWDVSFDSSPSSNYLLYEAALVCSAPETQCPDQLYVTIGAGHSLRLPTLTLYLIAGSNICPRPLSIRKGVCQVQVKGGNRSSYTAVMNFPRGFFYEQNGAYASGLLPGFQIPHTATSGQIIPQGRTQQILQVTGHSAPNQLSMITGPSPSTNWTGYGNHFEWDASSNDGATSLSFTMTDPYQVAVDSRNGFLSGILLGVAGSALVTLIVEALHWQSRPDDGVKAVPRFRTAPRLKPSATAGSRASAQMTTAIRRRQRQKQLPPTLRTGRSRINKRGRSGPP
jgi:hypothetical protein